MRLKLFLSLFLFCLVSFKGYSQDLVTICALPDEVSESSGLVVLNENNFLTHNDGGDAPKIYFLDSTGAITKEVYVENVLNTDWEDITINQTGHVFVGDFGNNNQQRKDLKILRLPPISNWNDTISAETITLTYANQKEFPPSSERRFFDCEAIASFSDSLLLISKNWSNPYTGFAYFYKISSSIDSASLVPFDSLYTGTIKEISWVTSATISDSFLYLLSSAHYWKISIVKGLDVSSSKKFPLNHFSQKEAIDVHNGTIFITDESTGGFGNLYKVREPVSNSQTIIREQPVYIYKDLDKWVIRNKKEESISYKLYSVSGKLVGEGAGSKNFIPIENSTILNDAIYVLEVTQEGVLPQYFKISKL